MNYPQKSLFPYKPKTRNKRTQKPQFIKKFNIQKMNTTLLSMLNLIIFISLVRFSPFVSAYCALFASMRSRLKTEIRQLHQHHSITVFNSQSVPSTSQVHPSNNLTIYLSIYISVRLHTESNRIV